jgi:four helix bundle protein
LPSEGKRIKNSKLKMKKAESSPGGSKNVPPRDIVERAFEFAARIIQLCGKLDERRGVGRVMMSQILRAGTSVPSNVEEAQAAQSRADFNSKMSIALKEADEIKRVIGAIIVSSKRGGEA